MDMRVAPAELLLAQPRGFCAGVVRAIDVVEQALALFGAPVYVFHEIVHNGHVVQGLQCRGAVFVDQIDQIPPRSVTIFSAHGVARSVVDEARSRQLRVIDATCPLVAKVQLQAQRYAQAGRTVLVIGHPGHDEVVATLGRIDGPAHVVPSAEAARQLDLPADTPLAYVTQTTLSVDDTRGIIAVLVARFPGIQGPALADICYATQNRQTAVRIMAQRVDRLLVVGSRNSSNACRLREVGEQQGVPSWLVEDASEIDPDWLLGARCIGVTAGASTPECLVQGVCDRLRGLGARHVRQLPGKPETVSFRLPTDLTDARAHLDAPGLPA
ncbi:4-hydroxy-3-methylbut-2-enyl diphosphate reductase [Pseudaquabacterium pictum]|uniref:4-hydroxy-3-methylbut-2-enyl diphosphate reductase n=1 Tax=Pseudaquabacterium pictum TaxID=2315236 RepID=A0A480B077_9BURK|nr:4-hydroxy-3-methylbut-2-enyl diphosphate reductase [Rubrivivax pictus]GCL65385.1 4-hydroxy-3-methylbut-2-enyl diphosphate reductase 2 [Rubrivivax pictus]